MIFNTFVMTYMGRIEEQRNAGVLFVTPKLFKDEQEALEDLITSIFYAMNDCWKISKIKHYKPVFIANVYEGVTDNIGYFDEYLQDYQWKIGYFEDVIEEFVPGKSLAFTIDEVEDLFDINEDNKCDWADWYKEVIEKLTLYDYQI